MLRGQVVELDRKKARYRLDPVASVVRLENLDLIQNFHA